MDDKQPISAHPLYKKWRSMKERCYCKKHRSYPDYGGRGIKVCNLWRCSSKEFIKWSEANGYRPGLQIDRIDNNGDYTPENCRYVTQDVNATNTRATARKEQNTEEVRRMVKSGVTAEKIARDLGISRGRVSLILRELGMSQATRHDRKGDCTISVYVDKATRDAVRKAAYKEGRTIGWIYDAVFDAGMNALGIVPKKVSRRKNKS